MLKHLYIKNKINFKLLCSIILILTTIHSCKRQKDNIIPAESSYFPPLNDSIWERKSISSLGWNQNALQPLYEFLAQKNSKSFMILVNGRIVIESYFNGHHQNADWEWNSAGKTLVASTTGIAQQEGLLQINHKVSDYLGKNWTNMAIEKENLIQIKHVLSMTSGIDDSKQLTIRSNLNYLADAGTRWAYGNVFQKLTDVVASSSQISFENYFKQKLKNKIGMDGYWNFGPIFTIYHSTTRSMARFGIMALNKGKWNNEQILNEAFFNECVSSSQSINTSYGYLWWLNGKINYIIPGGQTNVQSSLIPNAPKDMFCAMGASDQRLYIIPSKNMIVVRMGDAADPNNPTFAVSGFDQELWEKINALIN